MKTRNKLGKNAPKQSVDNVSIGGTEWGVVKLPGGLLTVAAVEESVRDRVNTLEHEIERLEEEKNAKLISYDELKKSLPELAEWMKIISRYGNVDSVSQIFRDKREPERHFMYIFTDEHCYSISAYAPTDKRPRGYLGCISSCRKPRVGETWTRGSDLADGPYSKETFIKIMGDIISYELKTIQFGK